MKPGDADTGDGFLSRWSRRKALAREGTAPAGAPTTTQGAPATKPLDVEAQPAPTAPGSVMRPREEDAAEPGSSARAGSGAATPLRDTPPPPTLADVAQLGHESDFTRFVAPGVDSEVKNAALKKLFGDPRFNVMDGLDTYIDDYSKPDPLPLASLRKMTQAAFLGLVEATPQAAAPAAPTAPCTTEMEADAQASSVPSGGPDIAPLADVPLIPATHENADLRLQPHDAAGCAGAAAGAAANGRIEP
jgi:hypothetical protein